MPDALYAQTINKWLAEDYRVLDGRPIYKIVWSDDELELRIGKWNVFYGKIFVREYIGAQTVKKYWYMRPPRYVLEKLVFMNNQEALKELIAELPDARNGSYEPVYSFVDGKDNPLPLNFEVVERIIWTLHNPTKRYPSDLRDEQRKEEAAEVKYFEEEIGKDERSPLFVFENSAFVSSNQLEYREKLNDSSVTG